MCPIDECENTNTQHACIGVHCHMFSSQVGHRYVHAAVCIHTKVLFFIPTCVLISCIQIAFNIQIPILIDWFGIITSYLLQITAYRALVVSPSYDLVDCTYETDTRDPGNQSLSTIKLCSMSVCTTCAGFRLTDNFCAY